MFQSAKLLYVLLSIYLLLFSCQKQENNSQEAFGKLLKLDFQEDSLLRFSNFNYDIHSNDFVHQLDTIFYNYDFRWLVDCNFRGWQAYRFIKHQGHFMILKYDNFEIDESNKWSCRLKKIKSKESKKIEKLIKELATLYKKNKTSIGSGVDGRQDYILISNQGIRKTLHLNNVLSFVYMKVKNDMTVSKKQLQVVKLGKEILEILEISFCPEFYEKQRYEYILRKIIQ